MIAAPMSWTHELEKYIPSGSLNKGRNYFRSGLVEIVKGSATDVVARVKGGGAYDVEMRLAAEEDTVVVRCTCPHYEGLHICKHIWATLLKAESAGYLTKISEISEPSIETELEREPENNDEFDEFDEFRAEPTFSKDQRRKISEAMKRRYKQMRGAQPQKTPVLPPWKQHLASLAASAQASKSPAEGPRRVMYAIDVPQSESAAAIVVQAAVSRLKKNGDWSKPGLPESSIRAVSQLDAADRQLLTLLAGSHDVGVPSYNYYVEPDSVRSRHCLLPDAQHLLISMLAATGRFYLRLADRNEEMRPLAWDDGPAWSVKIQIVRSAADPEYVIFGYLERSDERRPLAEPVLLPPGLVVFSDRVARYDSGDMGPWVEMLRSAGDLHIPFKQRKDLVTLLAQLPVLPAIEFPEELRIESLVLDRAALQIRALPESRWRQPKLACSVTFHYGEFRVTEISTALSIYDKKRDRHFRRDRKREEEALRRLADLGFTRVTWVKHQWELPPSRLPLAVRTLVDEGWLVEADGKLYRRAGSFQINVASRIDWFELKGQADFEGQIVGVPELLKAIARGEHMVPLGDGTFGLVPEEWLKQYRLVAALGKAGDGRLRFERNQVGFLDALLAEQPEVTFDEAFVRIRKEIASFGGVEAGTAAPTFNGELREYQRDGLGWLHFLRRFGFGGCLADDMGLGKTVQLLALLDSTERAGPCLIVVPRSLIFNWKQEAARFTPRLRVLDHTGADRMDHWDEIQKADIVVTTYGTLRRDAALLKDITFDTIVLDEAQAIKNANTESAKAARLLKARNRLALTGTPVENRLNDLWSVFDFLNPGLLGTASVFHKLIAKKNGRTEASSPADNESLRMLAKALRPFLLRRTKEQVAPELPSKTEQTIYCELEPEQRRLYDELRLHYRSALLGRIDNVGIEKSRMQILEALLRLRQAACHPGLIDKQRAGQSSAKLDALIPQITELVDEGHKALVFSQFTSFLDIVKRRLAEEQLAYEYLDGQTRDREACVQRFQEDGHCRLFLISLKAGGVGLNLTAAGYVFLLDPWWNPAIEAQAIDRSHRIGQSRNVFAYRLIARDTVEEKILDLQKAKRELADAIITTDNSALAGLTREHLELLLE